MGPEAGPEGLLHHQGCSQLIVFSTVLSVSTVGERRWEHEDAGSCSGVGSEALNPLLR